MIDVRIRSGLLWRHVSRRTQCDAERSQSPRVGTARGAQRLGDSEVGNDSGSARYENVFRLDVTVYDACLVRIRQRRRDLPQYANRFRNRKLSALRQSRAQLIATNKRHRVIRKAFRFSGGEQWYDVRMLKLGGQLYLAAEPINAHGGRHFRRQNFHHDLSAQRGFVRDEHAGHSAPPELLLEDVRIAECGLQLIAKRRHHVPS